MLTTIVERERELDAVLQSRSPGDPVGPALREAARAWSEAVWDAAERASLAPLTPDDREAGLVLARRPVFVCGAHRSGTTLVRDLLDGHPALSVLPSEGTYFTSLEAHLASRAPGEQLRFLGTEWARRLANPINQPPYWLLGRSTDDTSPYVAFARALQQWWAIADQRLRGVSSWPLVAVALAYASCAGQLASAVRWVEKTPTNERFEARLRAEFPEAVIVHVVRHPLAVFASRKRQELRAFGAFRQARRALGELAASYRVALARRSAPRYHVTRYEDVIADPRAAMESLTRALEIDVTPGLFQPTVAGRPVSANSSFAPTSAPPGAIIARTGNRPEDLLTPLERRRVAAAVGDAAAAFGYALPIVGGWEARMLNWLGSVESKF